MSAADQIGKIRKLHCLELLRFILAFLTMTWHYYCFGPAYGQVKLAGFSLPAFRYLSFTVEVFFIISGFIIIASAINRNPVEFMIGRIVRLAPCLLICATITLTVEIFLDDKAPIGNYLASISLLPLAFFEGIDGSYWSLRFEIIFYSLIFSVLCLIDIGRNIYKISLLIISYDVFSLFVCHFFGVDNYFSDIIQYPGEKYAPFFAVGILLYLAIGQKKVNLATVSTLLAACFLGCIRCYQEANRIAEMASWPHASVVDGCCIFFVVFGIFVCFAKANGSPRFNAIYSRLGRASYPLYLIHQNIGYSIFAFSEKRFGPQFDIRPVVMIAMVILAGTIANLAEPALAAQYRKWLLSMSEAIRQVYPRALKSKIGDVE
jgi:peptidoglycan/LPS O-acetylase OafA/YrhL